MLTGFLRTIVLFFVTAVVLRLMGKRQLGEWLSCNPMKW